MSKQFIKLFLNHNYQCGKNWLKNGKISEKINFRLLED